MFFFLAQTEQGDIFKITLETDEDMVSSWFICLVCQLSFTFQLIPRAAIHAFKVKFLIIKFLLILEVQGESKSYMTNTERMAVIWFDDKQEDLRICQGQTDLIVQS